MPNVVLNASTLIKGGAIQACVAFIKEALKTKHEIDWFFIISSEIEEELQRFHIQIRQHKNTLVAASPARNRKSRALIKAHVERIAPDAVFTFFGPSYVVFQVPHLLGVADPWITHATWLAIRKKGGVSALIRLLGIYVYKRIW